MSSGELYSPMATTAAPRAAAQSSKETHTMQESSIQLNHRLYPYREGATVATLMAENNFEFSHIIVKINSRVIEEEDWSTEKIAAGDNVEIIHVFGGG